MLYRVRAPGPYSLDRDPRRKHEKAESNLSKAFLGRAASLPMPVPLVDVF
jgi:hypothetical protein